MKKEHSTTRHEQMNIDGGVFNGVRSRHFAGTRASSSVSYSHVVVLLSHSVQPLKFQFKKSRPS